MKIRLTSHEMLMCGLIGLARHISALTRGLPDKNGHEGVGWNNHIEGACGELAVAKALGVFWSGSVNTFKRGGDVGGIQVRTRSQPEYDLIIRDDDCDDDTFVLVTGQCPEYDVVGKILGHDGKQDIWRQTYGGRPAAWFVPQAALEPIF